ncbi:MAG: hypothetical protein KUG74_02805 [Rhodobacteraceae bacterium]|nr:hypothetical protein [Paracoccaceae bacterium]
MSAISLLSLIGIFVVMPLLVRSRIKGEADRKKPEENEQYSVIDANSSEFGPAQSYQVPKDPDEYARIFVPSSKKKDS